MKLGIIIGHLGLGGAERVAANLANWFTNKGDSVVFFTTKKPAEKEYHIETSIARHCCFAESHFKIISNLRKALKKENPDVVLIMSTPMCVYAIPALSGLRIPKVVSERSAPGNAKIKKSTRKISNFLMRFADAYVFQTNGAKSYFDEDIQRKGYVIPNPLVVSELPDPFTGNRTKRFVAMGRLVKEKNYPLMIAAFIKVHEKHPEFNLEIYGDGSEKELLQRIIDRKKVGEYVELCGARKDVLPHVRDAYAFILSSDLEGMPNALIEAMSIGLPCISTDCPSGGPFDLIKDQKNGILVKAGDCDGMAEAIEQLINDPLKAEKMGAEAVTLRNRLDINVIGEQWKAVMQSVLGKSAINHREC